VAIKINEAGFLHAIQEQKTAIEAMRSLYEELDQSFYDLLESWQGRARSAFGELAQELTCEALMGIFMLTSLNKQTTSSLDSFMKEDSKLSKSIFQ